MDDDGGAASVGPSPIQSGTGTNTASVGCTEGGGNRLAGVDDRLSAFVLPVGVKSSFGETRSSLVVMNPWLLGRTADASGTGDLQ